MIERFFRRLIRNSTRSAIACFVVILSSNGLAGSRLAMADGLLTTRNARQLIVVLAQSWNPSVATLTRYERASKDGSWKQVGEKKSVATGARGFAWGLGEHTLIEGKGSLNPPIMDEGDQRSPVGIFSISTIFGYEAANSLAPIKIPYRRLTPLDVCVDDPNSKYYNQVVTKAIIPDIDWKSAEPMRSKDDGYKLRMIYDQNPAPSVARKGSCLFLHVGPTSGGTFGCTTLGEPQMREIISWLDSEKNPKFVQLPAELYDQVQSEWGLPRKD